MLFPWKHNRWPLLLTCILSTGWIAAQPTPRFQYYCLEDGLSQSYVFSLLQDSKGLMWFGTEDGLNQFNGYDFKVYRYDQDDSTSLSNNNVHVLFEDPQERLWVGTLFGGLNCFDRQTETFRRWVHDPENPASLSSNIITGIVMDQRGVLWIGTWDGGLNYIDPADGSICHYLNIPEDSTSLSSNTVNTLLPDPNGHLWIGTAKGLNRLDPETGEFKRYFHDPADPMSLAFDNAQSLLIDKSGTLWVGGRTLDAYDPVHDNFIHYLNDPAAIPYPGMTTITTIREGLGGGFWLDSFSGALALFDPQAGKLVSHIPLTVNGQQPANEFVIHSLEVDREGGVWVGTRKCLFRYDTRSSEFRHYRSERGNPRALPEETVWSFFEDHFCVLWVKTDSKVVPFDLDTGVIPDEKLSPASKRETINEWGKGIFEDHSRHLWIGGGKGLFLFDLDKNKLNRHFPYPQLENTLKYPLAWRPYVARDGTFWTRTALGLTHYDPVLGTFTFYSHDPNHPDCQGLFKITHFLEDRQGDLWMGCTDDLIRFDPVHETFRHYHHDPKDPTTISYDLVHAILEDHNGRIWVTTPNGLNLLDRETNTFTQIHVKDGLPNEYVYGILEDDRGRLWMSTNKGIACLDTETMKFRNFTVEDGLQSNEFNDDSYYKSPTTGEMFFGGINGFTVFHPDSIRDNTLPPAVIISQLQYLEKDGNNSVLKTEKGIPVRRSITLEHFQKNLIRLELASLSYSKPAFNQFAYQLNGYDEDWVYLGNERQVSFTNLDPGNYTLLVKGSNGDGYWNEIPTTLKITILPPWYWNRWSKSLYALILLSGLYAFYRFQLGRRMAEAETIRLRELDEVKTRLYTNITHEFRTPLTVILGMVKNIRADTKRWLEEGLQIIHRNGQGLLRLVNQMLDLSKLESGAMPVQMVQGDIIVYLRYLTESFHSLAESREIGLHFISDEREWIMDYDPDKTQNIISNLLSNALKFTPPGGSVYLQIGKPENGYLPIQVRDTGIGIAAEKLPHIFDRFYQADDSATRRGEGTGIGLTLTRELVKLLEGRIEVKSRLEQGSVFSIWLPVHNEAPLAGTAPEAGSAPMELPSEIPAIKEFAPVNPDENRPLVLVVEDNEDVVRYLLGCLEGQYRLTVARDGQEGIEKAEELVPDIVISDVMMPRKDGFELCDTLKHNWLTSHIPVVLLTAKADAASRISGLRKGADAYLAKPFDEEELLVILEKLLELRKTLQLRYGSGEFHSKHTPETKDPATVLEDEFILRIKNIIEARLVDYTLDVPQICQEMATSRTQLHNKLKALTGKSTTEYIRAIRLAKARELLLTTDLNISEIAYQCGFQLPHYFTRVFSEAEGCSPSVFRQKNKK